MEEKNSSEIKSEQTCQNPMEETTTYHFEGRSYIVQPVFKTEGENTLGAILLRLMRSEYENNEE